MDIDKTLTGTLRRLRHVQRYSSHPVIKGENVAEHSYFTTLYALLIADDIMKTNQGVTIDYAKLLSGALLHDMEESATGDLGRMIKHRNQEIQGAMKKIEIEVVQSLSTELQNAKLFERWKTAKDPKTIEGQIVAIADIWTVVAYVVEEISMGNTSMWKIFTEVYNYLQDIVEGQNKLVKDKVVMTYVINAIVMLDIYQNMRPGAS